MRRPGNPCFVDFFLLAWARVSRSRAPQPQPQDSPRPHSPPTCRNTGREVAKIFHKIQNLKKIFLVFVDGFRGTSISRSHFFCATLELGHAKRPIVRENTIEKHPTEKYNFSRDVCAVLSNWISNIGYRVRESSPGKRSCAIRVIIWVLPQLARRQPAWPMVHNGANHGCAPSNLRLIPVL